MDMNSFIPREAVTKVPRIVLLGCERMLIEHHNGIIVYSLDKLTVRLGSGFLTVSGCRLTIEEFSALDMAVSGRINALEFSQ